MADDKEMSAPVMDGNGTVTGHIISTTIGGKNGEPKQTVSYMAERVVGTGSFGIVFQAKCIETGETVAIKKVLQDRRYKNRELQLMRTMDHPNIVSLKHCFFSTTSQNELFLNLVMEYVPESMFRVLKHYSDANQKMPLIYVKLYTYQIFRGLAYMHSVAGVCHRDLKPQNVLVDPATHIVKICDFGSAKVLVRGEANISYICSRFYRAPELIFGATEYTTSIDIWSAGCVLAELLLGQPLFPGENSVGQLVEVIKVLGTPTREEIRCMNPNYNDFRFPQIKAHPWHKSAELQRWRSQIFDIYSPVYPSLCSNDDAVVIDIIVLNNAFGLSCTELSKDWSISIQLLSLSQECVALDCHDGNLGISQKNASRSNRSYFQVAAILSKSSLHCSEFLLYFLQSVWKNDVALVEVNII
ncbi:hypothetical protein SASPL_157866 [Salvia splendens]|uniref:non-specific serine/threonine protein kinase n=1 Tax=Salvia splendens TaxID=180675 RepID=A0A8X8VU77_SALSN|nr:hypothetical protein SASPL_157866 [Salvia splendens]